MDLQYLKYQLKYDSAHLRFPFKVEVWDKGIIVDGHKIHVFNQKNPVINLSYLGINSMGIS